VSPLPPGWDWNKAQTDPEHLAESFGFIPERQPLFAEEAEARDRRYGWLEAERARLEQIVIDMGAENKRLELKVERLQRDMKERGEINAKLNRELQRALSLPK
jgi:hypothetical protein